MRKKIEELRNREEGFTLVELLAVIVILGIIVAIAIPAVGSVIDTAGSNADKAEKELVADAARLYVTTERETLEKDSKFGTADWDADLDVSTLYSTGYLENRADDTDLGGTVNIKRTKENNDSFYTYTYDPEKVTSGN